MERLVTQKLLDAVQKVAKQELDSGTWLKPIAQLSGRSYDEMRVTVLKFLDIDVFTISAENCVSYLDLDPVIDSWDIIGIEIVLNRRLAPAHVKKLEFVGREASGPPEEEPGLQEFLRAPSMSGDASEEEVEFLKRLRFKGRRPTALYFYRELQSLRDPLHFPGPRAKSAGRSQPQGVSRAADSLAARWPAFSIVSASVCDLGLCDSFPAYSDALLSGRHQSRAAPLRRQRAFSPELKPFSPKPNAEA